MKSQKLRTVFYWIATALTAASYLFGGYAYIQQGPEVVGGMSHLGYPPYFIIMLGVWKLLGAVTILAPRLLLLKEWAYAGMVINLTGATISNAVVGNPPNEIAAPVIGLVLVAASYVLRPASRRLLPLRSQATL